MRELWIKISWYSSFAGWPVWYNNRRVITIIGDTGTPFIITNEWTATPDDITEI